MRCAERIRKVTEEASFDEIFRVTLSAGVSQYVPGETIEETLRRSDTALYEAKHLGHNRIAADKQFQEVEIEDEVSDATVTNIVIGPFGSHRNQTAAGAQYPVTSLYKNLRKYVPANHRW